MIFIDFKVGDLDWRSEGCDFCLEVVTGAALDGENKVNVSVHVWVHEYV